MKQVYEIVFTDGTFWYLELTKNEADALMVKTHIRGVYLQSK